VSIIGAILIIAACFSIGLNKSRQLKMRTDTLSELISFLEILNNEIVSNRTPIKRILSSNILPEYSCISSFIDELNRNMEKLGSQSFSHIWSRSLECIKKYLSHSVYMSLKILGNSIGRYDGQLQSMAINRCIYELSAEYEVVKQSLKSNQKVYMGLSTGIGIIISLVLI